ncbi:MAG TPA: helix-turn-helix domain-containing protein [Pseudonocardiaceae bacterium]|jgi:DNA-binding IclR family transcriptional regulator|nr:helix-turn-helix domain-containing protein [Pseudonocardiaceae bacterium]
MVDQRQLPQSIDRAFAILIELQGMCYGARLSELARRTGLAKSTMHRLLGALVNVGVVSRNGNVYQAVVPSRDGCSEADSEQRTLLNDLAPFLGDLMVRTGFTASLAVLRGTDVIFPHRVYGHQGVWTSGDDTGREPAHRTAAGRLLLAYDSRTARQLTNTCELTIEEEARLTRELLAIRRQHFAVNTTGNAALCVAVPLHRRPDLPNVAFTLKGKLDKIEPEMVLEHMRAVVGRAANKVMNPRVVEPIRQPRPTRGPVVARPVAGARMAS